MILTYILGYLLIAFLAYVGIYLIASDKTGKVDRQIAAGSILIGLLWLVWVLWGILYLVGGATAKLLSLAKKGMGK